MTLEARLIAGVQTVYADWTRWYDVDESLGGLAEGPALLGGDALRPYVLTRDRDDYLLVGIRRATMTDPPLMGRLMDAPGAQVTAAAGPSQDSQLVSIRCPATVDARLLDLPSVVLLGLGNVDRYRGRRLNLGLARLAQWLRFTHAASVRIIDTGSGDEWTTPDDLAAADIIGIGVNFGQWDALLRVAGVIEELDGDPWIVLGNIVASTQATAVASLFPQRATFVARGYGEVTLEHICAARSADAAPEAVRAAVPGLAVAQASARFQVETLAPASAVFPDARLVASTIDVGGQLALEASFGCQYGACLFCPRGHRGAGWATAEYAPTAASLQSVADACGDGEKPLVAFIDEEFFGSPGLTDASEGELASAKLLGECARLGLPSEIYTRIEQLYSSERSAAWNRARATLLDTHRATIRRLFVGVESGSDVQLRRYGKGQTVDDIVHGIRVASTLGLPLEFGFITFDPLMGVAELIENLAFLAREDVALEPEPELVLADPADVAGNRAERTGAPLYLRAAYLATELEVLFGSPYERLLRRRAPELLLSPDSNFSRYVARYADPVVDEVAGWSRVWTEGTFRVVYETRMKARATGDQAQRDRLRDTITSYRRATFELLRHFTAFAATGNADPAEVASISGMPESGSALPADPIEAMHVAATEAFGVGMSLRFDARIRHERRAA